MYITIPDCKNSDGSWVTSYRDNGDRFSTKSYEVWRAMLKRCNPTGKLQKKYPSYVGCSASDKFKDFQLFADWYVSQIGYGIFDYTLDKDLLFRGNKCYGESTCVLIPRALNTFLLDCKAARGIYPQGVCRTKHGNFMVSMSYRGVVSYLGVYDTPEQAYAVYKTEKEAGARKWAEDLKNGMYLVDIRVINALENWVLE